jgi:hypothetical protein
MIRVEDWLGRQFHWKTYNCWDFAREVWLAHSGVDAGKREPLAWNKESLVNAFSDQRFDVEGSIFKRIAKPVDPCLALFVRPGVLSHCGVWVRGKVLHLPIKRQAVLQPLEDVMAEFTEVRWYT